MRVGCPWSFLPSHFECWNSVYKRFNALLKEADFEWMFINGTYVKAHQRSSGAASGQPETIAKSYTEYTSKIHLAADAHGFSVAFEITGGDINDCSAAPELIAQLPSVAVIVADKSYDSEPHPVSRSIHREPDR